MMDRRRPVLVLDLHPRNLCTLREQGEKRSARRFRTPHRLVSHPGPMPSWKPPLDSASPSQVHPGDRNPRYQVGQRAAGEDSHPIPVLRRKVPEQAAGGRVEPRRVPVGHDRGEGPVEIEHPEPPGRGSSPHWEAFIKRIRSSSSNTFPPQSYTLLFSTWARIRSIRRRRSSSGMRKARTIASAMLSRS